MIVWQHFKAPGHQFDLNFKFCGLAVVVSGHPRTIAGHNRVLQHPHIPTATLKRADSMAAANEQQQHHEEEEEEMSAAEKAQMEMRKRIMKIMMDPTLSDAEKAQRRQDLMSGKWSDDQDDNSSKKSAGEQLGLQACRAVQPPDWHAY